jgi:preprotein translocase subunit SecF
MEGMEIMNHQTKTMLEKLAEEIKIQQGKIVDLEHEIAKAKKKIFDALESNEVDTITVGESESETKITIVRPTSLKFNEEKLKEKLSDKQWRQITKTVLDKKAIEDAVARGTIDISIISANSVEVASKPYLRITGANT